MQMDEQQTSRLLCFFKKHEVLACVFVIHFNQFKLYKNHDRTEAGSDQAVSLTISNVDTPTKNNYSDLGVWGGRVVATECRTEPPNKNKWNSNK
jgi:hypothetical protein